MLAMGSVCHRAGRHQHLSRDGSASCTRYAGCIQSQSASQAFPHSHHKAAGHRPDHQSWRYKNRLAAPEPSNLTVNSSCQYIYFPVKQLIGRTDTLTWTSVSNATGYTVFMNGSQITKVTGTSYQVNYPLSQSATSYGVAAYNSFGTSATKTTSAPGC